MTKDMTAGLKPMHPGEFLREDILPNVRMAKTDIAKALGISRAQLYAILDEKATVTAPMALRLGKFFGNGPELWLNLQNNFDIAVLRPKLAKALDRIPLAPAA
jgi:addiction module HigA family antidote